MIFLKKSLTCRWGEKHVKWEKQGAAAVTRATQGHVMGAGPHRTALVHGGALPWKPQVDQPEETGGPGEGEVGRVGGRVGRKGCGCCSAPPGGSLWALLAHSLPSIAASQLHGLWV